MGRRLRSAIDRDDERPSTIEEPVPSRDVGPFVDFVAYADDCTLSGQIRLGGERLTDLLNGRDEWQLVDVMAESFDGEELVESKEVAIPRGGTARTSIQSSSRPADSGSAATSTPGPGSIRWS
jgi:hypothetical protein